MVWMRTHYEDTFYSVFYIVLADSYSAVFIWAEYTAEGMQQIDTMGAAAKQEDKAGGLLVA